MSNAFDLNNLDNMACSTSVHLQILTPTKAIRLKTTLIGVDPNMSVILAMHNDQHWSEARNYIREGQGAIIRLIDAEKPDAYIVAFRSNIQKIMSIAGNWLIMDYPKELQKVALRKYSRIPIHIECELIGEKAQSVLSSGFLHDISLDGCAFIGELLRGGSIGAKYQLQVRYAKENLHLVIPITVKNILDTDIQTGQKQYGLVFDNDGQETQEFVQKAILHHLSR